MAVTGMGGQVGRGVEGRSSEPSQKMNFNNDMGATMQGDKAAQTTLLAAFVGPAFSFLQSLFGSEDKGCHQCHEKEHADTKSDAELKQKEEEGAPDLDADGANKKEKAAAKAEGEEEPATVVTKAPAAAPVQTISA